MRVRFGPPHRRPLTFPLPEARTRARTLRALLEEKIMAEEIQLTYAVSQVEEHQNILRAHQTLSTLAWEFGVRLLRFRQTFGWQDAGIPGAPFSDWTQYLRRGVGVAVATAYKYMDAATFPRWCLDQVGVERLALLRKICELTTVDETPEQAMALELPVGPEGGTKRFVDMTVDEVDRAYRLLREQDVGVRRPERLAAQQAAEQLQRCASLAVETWLKPDQVRARPSGEDLVLDVRGVRRAEAGQVFEALANALRP